MHVMRERNPRHAHLVGGDRDSVRSELMQRNKATCHPCHVSVHTDHRHHVRGAHNDGSRAESSSLICMPVFFVVWLLDDGLRSASVSVKTLVANT
jgi:hypothetical protein